MSAERQAITASSLADGEVVFRAGGGWVRQLSDAELFTTADAAQAELEAAKAEVTTVVDVYVIELSVTDDGLPVPKSFRERIRALGPPVTPGLGKQAQGGSAIDAIAHAEGAARSSGRLSLIRRK